MDLQNPTAGASGSQPHWIVASLRRTRDTVAAAPPLWSYLWVAVLTAGAAMLSSAVSTLFASSIFLPFFPVVALSAWLGGLRAGVAASVFGAAAAHLVSPPVGATLLPGPEHVLLLLTFVVAGSIVSYLIDSLRQARIAADHHRLEANEFAATLHLRLMLAEKEIERLRTAVEETAAPPPDVAVPAAAPPPEREQFLPWPIRIAQNGNGHAPHGDNPN